MYLIVPYILPTLTDVLIVTLGEFPALPVVYYTIDNKVMGRKLSLILSFAFLICLHLGIFFFRRSLLVVGIFAINFFMRVMYQNMNVLCTEAYSTTYRSVGAGWNWGLGRLSGFAGIILKKLF